MKLSSIRLLSGLKPVLKNPEATGPDPVYWVFSEISKGDWYNTTVIAPGLFDGEYPKTFGHYHPDGAETEVYQVQSGEGFMILQKKHLENGQFKPEKVDEVLLIKAKAGDEIKITKEWGHSLSNIANLPLITFDNWSFGHSPSDYSDIESLHGMAYYLIEENGQPKAVPNPNYSNLPEPIWLTAQEFTAR